MSSHELIDAQFDRAVQIVQGLPKTGPIQTDYEEKLTMYSLYKQATTGNVAPPRPGFLDMLGRAKWDAWAKHKDLDPYEAKWLYIEALLKVLRKYSDKTVAMSLVRELESYGGDPANLVTSRSFSRSPGSESSGSTASDSGPYLRPPIPTQEVPTELAHDQDAEEETESEEEDEEGDEPRELLPRPDPMSQPNRPQSSLSSHRYRTPMAGSLAMSPPPAHVHAVPVTQPLPIFETPSAFGGDAVVSSPPGSYPTPSTYAHFSSSSRGELSSSPNLYGQPTYPPNQAHRPPSLSSRQYGPVRPASRPTLERAVENVQSHLAALTERLENLEAAANAPSRGSAVSSSTPGRGSPHSRNAQPRWDIDDMGMWSLVLNPLSTFLDKLKELTTFFARNENRSPSAIVVRRLCLDVSFLVCVVGLVRLIWRRSGVRRREVKHALIVLWRAILGIKPERSMIERGV
ncbi:ACBP-domain-containing protein [Pluteus cervinus]|uniref:ACBP-domain-containing protein n=1 Tax=Pluteus cervinus TaxID=181527 RepID=A0ACD3B9I7_9AGAR|nr:ACBP-domain-containing protein [Pluteus cervinus]